MTPVSTSSAAGRTARTASLPQQALLALYRAADGVRACLATVIEPHGITGPQYNVLRILRGAEPDGLPTLTIAERMIERAPGITRMIDRLEAKGLVERERRRDDRRCVHCRVTRKGLDLVKRLDRPVEGADRAAFEALTPRELEQLVALLERLPSATRGRVAVAPVR